MSDERESAAGVVGFIKPRKTAKGYTTYAFTFDDRDDDRWFGMYKTDPEELGAEVGAYVEFEYTTSGAGFLNVVEDTLEVLEGEEEGEEEEEEEAPKPRSKKKASKKKPASKKKASSGGQARAAAAKNVSSNKDANIQWQSARNAALTFTEIAQAAGILDLGTGKKGEKLEALGIFVNLKTVDFFTASMEVSETGGVPDVEVE